jgi:hypothetical protein
MGRLEFNVEVSFNQPHPLAHADQAKSDFGPRLFRIAQGALRNVAYYNSLRDDNRQIEARFMVTQVFIGVRQGA